MAITSQHFAFITKYVAPFVAQSLRFAMVVITRLKKKNARNGPFSQVVKMVVLYYYLRAQASQN